MRFAVNEPALRPVARRGAGGACRPPERAVVGRASLWPGAGPGDELGAFTERLLVEHVSRRPARHGLGRWFRLARTTTAAERRALPGSRSRALTASGQ